MRSALARSIFKSSSCRGRCGEFFSGWCVYFAVAGGPFVRFAKRSGPSSYRSFCRGTAARFASLRFARATTTPAWPHPSAVKAATELPRGWERAPSSICSKSPLDLDPFSRPGRGYELQRVPREHPHRAIDGVRRYISQLDASFQRSAATPPSAGLIHGQNGGVGSRG